jgi:orotidine-5'-phosphate decarboxylase
MQDVMEVKEDLEEGVHVRNTSAIPLYEMVMRKASAWGTPGNLMFVVGATQAGAFTRIRNITPDHFFLVPGVGAQGGSLSEISEKAMNADCGILVNVSRAVIYASGEKDFAEAAGRTARSYQQQMRGFLPPRK